MAEIDRWGCFLAVNKVWRSGVVIGRGKVINNVHGMHLDLRPTEWENAVWTTTLCSLLQTVLSFSVIFNRKLKTTKKHIYFILFLLILFKGSVGLSNSFQSSERLNSPIEGTMTPPNIHLYNSTSCYWKSFLIMQLHKIKFDTWHTKILFKYHGTLYLVHSIYGI